MKKCNFKGINFQDSVVAFILLIAMFAAGFVLSPAINEKYEKKEIRRHFSNEVLALEEQMRIYVSAPSDDALEELRNSISSFYIFISEHTPDELEMEREKCLSMREFFCSLQDIAIVATYCPEHRDFFDQILDLSYDVFGEGDVKYPYESMNFCENYDSISADSIIEEIEKAFPPK